MNCWPKPIQKPHPPIYIPGGGSIETWDFCLDHDYNYSYLSFYGYLRGKSLLDGYWERVAKRGKDDSPYRAAFAQIICVADTDAEAEELYAEHCLYFFNRCLHVFPPFADPPGYRTINTIKYGALSPAPRRGAEAVSRTSPGRSSSTSGFIIAGSPETVRQQLEECIKGLRIGHLFCLFHIGNMPDWKTRYSTKLFAEKVMPQLRDLWPEWKHDDRWWIKPMDDRLPPGGAPAAAREKIGAGVAAMKCADGRDASKGTRCRVLEGGSGMPLVFFHGAGGLLRRQPVPRPARRSAITSSRPSCRATASPPARSCSRTCSTSRSTAGTSSTRSGSTRPHLVGHSMGGMIAAEMAVHRARAISASWCWSPRPGSGSTSTRSPTSSPCCPCQLAELLFHDPAQRPGAAHRRRRLLRHGGASRSSTSASSAGSAMAGKILFPIPNRRLSKRLYRVTAQTLVLWGGADQLIVPGLRRALGRR